MAEQIYKLPQAKTCFRAEPRCTAGLPLGEATNLCVFQQPQDKTLQKLAI